MDDASLVAPDNWSGKNAYTPTQNNYEKNIIIIPPRKQFYCSDRRVRIALFSPDLYFTTGMRFMLEERKDIILSVNKKLAQSYVASVEKFETVIFSAKDARDLLAIYHMLIQLRLTHQKTVVVAIANDDMKPLLADLSKQLCGLKVLSANEKLSSIKHKIMKLLMEREEKNENKYFPATLTQRQADILLMAADGLSADAISLRTGVMASTVYKTKSRALVKAGATSKALEAVLYAQLKKGLLHGYKLLNDGDTYDRTYYH